MDAESVFELWETLAEVISNKEHKDALYNFLTFIYEKEVCELDDLLSYSESNDNEEMSREIKIFMRENGLFDEEDEEDY